MPLTFIFVTPGLHSSIVTYKRTVLNAILLHMCNNTYYLTAGTQYYQATVEVIETGLLFFAKKLAHIIFFIQ
jgi:hypothetical protein